jgi:hypothetical protein
MNKTDETVIVIDDLRTLLFWASVGVHLSRGGHREEDVPQTLLNYAALIGFELPYKPEFQEVKGQTNERAATTLPD